MGFGSILWQILDFRAKQRIKDTTKCCHWVRTTNIGLLYPNVRNNIGGDVSPASPAALTPVTRQSIIHMQAWQQTDHPLHTDSIRSSGRWQVQRCHWLSAAGIANRRRRRRWLTEPTGGRNAAAAIAFCIVWVQSNSLCSSNIAKG